MKYLSSFLLILLIATQGLHAQNTWTPEKIMSYKNVTDTHISSDGKYIAYVVRSPKMEGELSEYNSQIWIAAADGAFNIQYTQGEKSSSSPQFSPDSQKIAFLSDRNDNKSQV
ncbi:MAG: hypothetical protein RLN86_11415, partial [Cyclobacteriaceae bacterium]